MFLFLVATIKNLLMAFLRLNLGGPFLEIKDEALGFHESVVLFLVEKIGHVVSVET